MRGLRVRASDTGTGFAQPTGAGQGENSGHEQASDRIQVPERIQADAPELARRRIAAAPCDPAVRRLVHGDCEEESDDLHHDVEEVRLSHQRAPGPARVDDVVTSPVISSLSAQSRRAAASSRAAALGWTSRQLAK
jgi:hypothetical protein